MQEFTPEQRITLSAIDAAGNIAEAAQAIAHALTEAASVLRQITSPYGSEPCHGDCGWPLDEDLVEGEVPEEQAEDRPQDTTARFRAFVARQNAAKPELPIERPLAVERSDAGFTSGPIWVGGPGEYKGAHVYWSERDRGITHEALMDACEGLSASERRSAHNRAGVEAMAMGRMPSVLDLLSALAMIRRWSEEMDDLQRLGQEWAAAAREFGDLGWMSPIIDAAKDLSLEELEHLVDTLENPQEPQEAPNSAEPSPPADASETGSSASHAAPGGNLETAIGDDLDRIALEQFDGVRRNHGETDAAFRNFLLTIREIRAAELASDVVEMEREIQALAETHNLTPDGIEIHHPVKCTDPMRIQADLSRDVWDIRASASVDAGGLFHAVAESAPIKD